MNFLKTCFHFAIKNPFLNKIVQYQIHFNNLARQVLYGLFIEIVMITIDISEEINLSEI